MNKSSEILKFEFASETFSERGKSVISGYFSNLVERRILKLERISRSLGDNAFNDEYITNIEGVFIKFKYFFRQKNLTQPFDRRELRNLSYAFDYATEGETTIFQNPEEIKTAIDLLQENWRDSYLVGLFHCYLYHYRSKEKESFKMLANFVTNKLKNYDGTRSLHSNLKNNLKYFDKVKGDLELGVHLYFSNTPLSKVTDFLTLPKKWISYPYFEGVINAYFEKIKGDLDNHLEEITEALKNHSNNIQGTNANKVVVSKIICVCVDSSEEFQDKIKDVAFELVGDPGISANWRVSEEIGLRDKETIEQASKILNEWITRQFISVFFEKCINDARRKQFWLKYSKKINRFKVFGPKSVKNELNKDERISKYVDGRFQAVESKRTISAFMFSLGQHKMIEFSDPGYAFYAYKFTNNNAPEFDLKNLSSVDDFRNGNMPMLVYRKGYNLHSFSQEGRLSHNDGDLPWENVFSYWITKMSGIDV